jgi:hypothetical protein
MQESFVHKLLTMLLLVISFCGVAFPQESQFQSVPGSVTFISPQNIYIKFASTSGIAPGDTIFFDDNGKVQPAMIAKYLSSQSCAGPKVDTVELKVGDPVFALVKAENIKPNPQQTTVTAKNDTNASGRTITAPAQAEFTNSTSAMSRFYGSFSSNSYSNFTNTTGAADILRYSHSLSLDAEHIDGTPFYFSTYSNLSYLNTDWANMKANIFNNWKIYDVSAGYKEPDYDLWFGRHINYTISNLGPIDGLQGEGRLGNFWLGGLVGSRPDFYNMSFNIRFFEVGAYLSRVDTLPGGPMQNTIGVFQQTNDLKTDRRFLYLQHNSVISQSLSFFASTEVDLFKLQNNLPTNTISLTSLYLSTQLSPTHNLMLSLSYDARRNVIYYQTFASTFDSLFQNQLRQGFRLWMNWRPIPIFIVTLSGGYSYQKGDPLPSRDAIVTLTEPEIPLIDLSAAVSYNKIIGSFLNGTVYGATLTKYIPFSFSSLSVGYQRVNYSFGTSASALTQNVGTVQASFRVIGQVFFNLYYEGIFSHQTTYGTLVGGFTFRF